MSIMSFKASWERVPLERLGWHAEGRYGSTDSAKVGWKAVIFCSILEIFHREAGGSRQSELLTWNDVVNCVIVKILCKRFAAEYLLLRPLRLNVACEQDGKIFVVKIMHGSNLTEKAKDEVCLQAPGAMKCSEKSENAACRLQWNIDMLLTDFFRALHIC